MRAVNGIIAATIILLGGLSSPFSGLAPSSSVAENSIEITISTIQSEIVLGESIVWRIILSPKSGYTIKSIEITPGDKKVWAWVENVNKITKLKETMILELLTAPLIMGEISPTLEVKYVVGEEAYTKLVVSDKTVKVKGIESLVESGIIQIKDNARKGKPTTMELWIRNRSPFTLEILDISNNSVELSGDPQITSKSIGPDEFIQERFELAVKGENPQPKLSLEYTWTDSLGITRTEILHIQNEPIPVTEAIPTKEQLWGLFGVVVGILVGACANIVPRWIDERRSRNRQKKINYQYVIGLLRFSILRSEHGANHGTPVDLKHSEIMLQEENLFTILVENQLDHGFRELWKAAEGHNEGLNKPGSTLNAERLHKVAKDLNNKIDYTVN